MDEFDENSAESIIAYSKKLQGKTLRQVCSEEIEKHGYKGKGNFGQILEKFYFGYEPNSDSEPDFKEAGIELKSSPLKRLKRRGEFRSKERLVLNIINYLEVHKEEFETSTFWKKNSRLLLVFYMYEKDSDILDLLIKLVDNWEYPTTDLKIIKRDWETINQKIKEGKAHELSEGDTYYLGACTKGSTALKSYRNQPFNDKPAKQRAYSLKQGYVNHILANIAHEEKGVYGKVSSHPQIIESGQTIDEVVISKFKGFYGKSSSQIEKELGLNKNQKAKNYFANLTKAILGLDIGQPIEEFEKAEIIIKAIRVEENNNIKQSVSFPVFKFEDLYIQDWEGSGFKELIDKKFFFIFYKKKNREFILEKAKFWNMPYEDRVEAQRVWLKTKKIIQNGTIFKEYQRDKNGAIKLSVKGYQIKKNNFPKMIESSVCHVRPHAPDSTYTNPLPVRDVILKVKEYTKQSFWLNAKYVRDEIYLQE